MTKDKEPLTPREARNRNIIISCMLLGGAIAVALVAATHVTTRVVTTTIVRNGVTTTHVERNIGALGAFYGPVPPTFAIALAVIWGLALPVISLFWYRAIDEHERAAYRDGAEVAAFAYMIGAPIWWILWRGGLVAPPDNGFIFIAFNLIYAGVWLWRKYK